MFPCKIPIFMEKWGGFLGLLLKIGVFVEKRGFNRGLWSEIEVFVEKWRFRGVMAGNRGFGGKMVGFSKNEVFVGFWSRNLGK